MAMFMHTNKFVERQALHPDNSKIWLTFETATQFSHHGLIKYTVYFEEGRAVSIEKITADK